MVNCGFWAESAARLKTMQHSKRDNTWSKWGIFLGVAVALGALVVVGWTFMQNRFQPGSSSMPV